ncbi:MAG: glycosyltransferase family 1 protein [Rhodospirillales bacterium]|nr:glycosyltransferase family 1 protein [Rhodospirillales bacterium]
MERVELAYARHVAVRPGGVFCGSDALGRFGLIPRDEVAALLAPGADAAALARGIQRRLLLGGQRCLLEEASRPGAIFSIVSHHGLHRRGAIARLKQAGARFVPAVHDIIPIEYPQSTRWLQRRLSHARMRAVGHEADGVLLFSQSVRGALQAWLVGQGLAMPPALVAPLGLDLPMTGAAVAGAAPYFICIATIERRKNHRMLLEAWRRLGAGAPRLILVGRRSFGAGEALALLDSGALGDRVEERGHASDGELAGLLAGAQALLLPTLAEGFGIPVIEALAAGVPVLCSDIAVLREVGGAVPEYLSPSDPAAWSAMIAAYAMRDSPARAAQMARLAGWAPPHWAGHFAAVEAFLADLVAGRAAGEAKVAMRPRPSHNGHPF